MCVCVCTCIITFIYFLNLLKTTKILYIIISISCNKSTAYNQTQRFIMQSSFITTSSNQNPLVNAMDKIASCVSVPISVAASVPLCQYGENNHVEYKGVDISIESLQEKIMQFSFQLVRTKSEQGLSSHRSKQFVWGYQVLQGSPR